MARLITIIMMLSLRDRKPRLFRITIVVSGPRSPEKAFITAARTESHAMT